MVAVACRVGAVGSLDTYAAVITAVIGVIGIGVGKLALGIDLARRIVVAHVVAIGVLAYAQIRRTAAVTVMIAVIGYVVTIIRECEVVALAIIAVINGRIIIQCNALAVLGKAKHRHTAKSVNVKIAGLRIDQQLMHGVAMLAHIGSVCDLIRRHVTCDHHCNVCIFACKLAPKVLTVVIQRHIITHTRVRHDDRLAGGILLQNVCRPRENGVSGIVLQIQNDIIHLTGGKQQIRVEHRAIGHKAAVLRNVAVIIPVGRGKGFIQIARLIVIALQNGVGHDAVETIVLRLDQLPLGGGALIGQITHVEHVLNIQGLLIIYDVIKHRGVIFGEVAHHILRVGQHCQRPGIVLCFRRAKRCHLLFAHPRFSPRNIIAVSARIGNILLLGCLKELVIGGQGTVLRIRCGHIGNDLVGGAYVTVKGDVTKVTVEEETVELSLRAAQIDLGGHVCNIVKGVQRRFALYRARKRTVEIAQNLITVFPCAPRDCHVRPGVGLHLDIRKRPALAAA